MSGVYFRGMKMPEACNVCPAHHFYFPPTNFHDKEVITTAVAVCMALGKEMPNLSAENRKPDWCPAMSVPDHGRLGDLEELWATAYKAWGTEYDPWVCGLFMDMVNNAPTIIPADKEETE